MAGAQDQTEGRGKSPGEAINQVRLDLSPMAPAILAVAASPAVEVEIRADSSALQSVIGEVLEAARRASPEVLQKVSHLLLGFGDLGQELASVDVQMPAAGTGDVLVRLQPGDRLRMILAALRAGDADGL